MNAPTIAELLSLPSCVGFALAVSPEMRAMMLMMQYAQPHPGGVLVHLLPLVGMEGGAKVRAPLRA